MNKFNKKSIFAIVVLVLILAISLVLPLGTAFADYSDIVNDPTAIINFNQCVLNQYINNPTTGSLLNPLSDVPFSTNDKVLIRFDNLNSAEVIIAFHNNTTSAEQNITLHTSYYDIVTINGNYDVILSYIGTGGIIKNFNIFNLTKMFGASSEPNLDQAKDLFVADYYSYSSGTPVAYNTIDAFSQGYNEGLNSVFSDEPIIYTGSNFNDNFYFQIVGNESYKLFNRVEVEKSSIYGYSMSYLSLPTPIVSGDVVSLFSLTEGGFVEFWFSSSQDLNTLSPTIELCYLNNGYHVLTTISLNNGLVYKGSLNDNGVYYYWYDFSGVSFVAPLDFDNLFFRSSYNYTIVQPELRVLTKNPTSILKNSYDNGYEKAKQYYDQYYSQGGLGYQTIYNRGYYAYPTDDHFTFQKLIASSIDVPVQAFTKLFDYDILGVNMKTFYLSLFTLAVIVTIIRLVL